MDDGGIERLHAFGIHFSQFVHVGEYAGALLGHLFLLGGVGLQAGKAAEVQEILFIEGHANSLSFFGYGCDLSACFVSSS